MSELLFRAARRSFLTIAGLPLTMWKHYLWQEQKYRETRHLLRLEPYLLRDMGLKREGDRIVAVNSTRIEPGAPHHPDTAGKESSPKNHIRHAN